MAYLFQAIRKAYRVRGLWYVVFGAARMLSGYFVAMFLLPVVMLKRKSFAFRGDDYRYFSHLYNTTWMNERAVEVPLVYRKVVEAGSKRILEFGNVLSHYFMVTHDVLDKYEVGRGVINEDVVNFSPAEPYDLIVSISTLEHVGWDEDERDPGKILRAFDRLKRCLGPQGIMIVTLPLGQNPGMDRFLRIGQVGFTDVYCLERVSWRNVWQEANPSEVLSRRYDDPFPPAKAIVIGIYQASCESDPNLSLSIHSRDKIEVHASACSSLSQEMLAETDGTDAHSSAMLRLTHRKYLQIGKFKVSEFGPRSTSTRYSLT